MNADGEPIYDLEINRVYISRHGRRFVIRDICRHGQDCTVPMVYYENLDATKDYPPGQRWVIEESLFLKQFREE